MREIRAIDSIMLVSSDDRAFLTHRQPMAKAAYKVSKRFYVVCQDTGLIDKIRDLNYEVIPLKKRANQLSLFSILQTIKELVHIYRRIRPEIIHHSSLYVSFLGSIASLFVKGPKIITAITGVGYLFSSSSTKAVLARLVLTPLLRSLWLSSNHTTLFQNKDDQELFAQKRLSGSRAFIIPGSGVDIKKFRPTHRKYKNKRERFTIGCASRLLRDKGLEELIKAISLLPEGMNVELTIAGAIDLKNPSSFTPEKVKSWEKNSRINLLGQVTNMVDFWHRCDIAILPSHREGLPKSLLEAAACGLPLIGADVAGTRELINNGVNGRLFKMGQVDDITECIIALVENKLFIKKAGLASRRKIETEGFSDKAVGLAYQNFLLSIQNRA